MAVGHRGGAVPQVRDGVFLLYPPTPLPPLRQGSPHLPFPGGAEMRDRTQKGPPRGAPHAPRRRAETHAPRGVHQLTDASGRETVRDVECRDLAASALTTESPARSGKPGLPSGADERTLVRQGVPRRVPFQPLVLSVEPVDASYSASGVACCSDSCGSRHLICKRHLAANPAPHARYSAKSAARRRARSPSWICTSPCG